MVVSLCLSQLTSWEDDDIEIQTTYKFPYEAYSTRTSGARLTYFQKAYLSRSNFVPVLIRSCEVWNDAVQSLTLSGRNCSSGIRKDGRKSDIVN
uniref:Ovule protein n=1 Tax=Caenorhabditis tropicalis TaxID=1561998 RepID=A0A1I7U6A2_9PELO